MAKSENLRKSGFNVWAFLFTWLWYFVKGLWGKGLIILVGQSVLAIALGAAFGVVFGAGAAASAATEEAALGGLFGGALIGYWFGGFIAWLITAIYAGRSANGDLYIAVRQREKALE